MAARARAFAAMLAMPEQGVREAIRATGRVDAKAVRNVMDRYGCGPVATTWHLKNLGFVGDEQRAELLVSLQP
jgi:hypothetical protein